jgi:hypothetical protein
MVKGGAVPSFGMIPSYDLLKIRQMWRGTARV